MLAFTEIVPHFSTIIFIHGVGSSKESWTNVMKQLNSFCQHLHLLAVDLRGHDESTYENDDFTKDLDDYCEAILSVTK